MNGHNMVAVGDSWRYLMMLVMMTGMLQLAAKHSIIIQLELRTQPLVIKRFTQIR